MGWVIVEPPQYRMGDLIEYHSTDCGYVPPPPVFKGRYKLTLNDSSTVSAECDSSSAITSSDTSSYKSNIIEAEIGSCVTSIGVSTFRGCSILTSCTIGNGVTTINARTFQGCSGLTSIEIPSGVTTISNRLFLNCSGLTSVTIGNNVTSISQSVFMHCTNLKRINSNIDGVFNIPSGLTSIEGDTFYGCRSLTSIDIPSGVTSIGSGAFGWCVSLTNVNIPRSVTSIGEDAFYQCSGLTSITVEATTPPTLGSGAFNGTNDCPIYVPAASVNVYQSAWSDYASRIQAIP